MLDSSGMSGRRRWEVVGALIAVAIGVQPSSAQESPGVWQFDLSVSAALIRIEGDRTVSAGERVTPFAAGLADNRLAWSGRIEMGRNGWRGIIDVVHLGIDGRQPLSDESVLPISLRLTHADLLVSRRLGRGSSTGWVELSGGVRHHRLNQKTQLADGQSQELRYDLAWNDPLIGLRYLFSPSDRVGFLTKIELGGFGVGSSFSWGVRFGCLVRLTSTFGSLIEYRVLDVDYRSAAGTFGSFTYNGTSHGLVTSLLLHF